MGYTRRVEFVVFCQSYWPGIVFGIGCLFVRTVLAAIAYVALLVGRHTCLLYDSATQSSPV